ncbi:hypothetical protein CC78DRAFT_310221 [Lojkania enalia]|uniref:Uncharacterized protein n=1 Tax=Lojkania enalia TaxID=147567 RepID=A0A9P4N2L3_9PLEO|nr:hypothetical protein CC78DRAFT_310221 [Didymosphaeria enalia]
MVIIWFPPFFSRNSLKLSLRNLSQSTLSLLNHVISHFTSTVETSEDLGELFDCLFACLRSYSHGRQWQRTKLVTRLSARLTRLGLAFLSSRPYLLCSQLLDIFAGYLILQYTLDSRMGVHGEKSSNRVEVSFLRQVMGKWVLGNVVEIIPMINL